MAAWWQALRPRTLPASIVPVAIGSAAAFAAGIAPAGPDGLGVTVLCLGVALGLQIAANLANDAIDARNGVDAARVGPARATWSGWLSPRAVWIGTGVAVGAALLCGLGLVSRGGWPAVALGAICATVAVAYSGGPLRLAHRGLGELTAFVFFGPVAVCGTYWLHSGHVSLTALLASGVPGALAAALMLANNLRDERSDAAAGKRTLVVRIGGARARGLYAFALASAGALATALAIHTDSAWSLLPLLAAPLALPALRTLLSARTPQALLPLLAATARLNAVAGLLLALGLLL